MNVNDLELEDILPLVHTPAEQHDPHTLNRRRFIQGATAAAAGLTVGTSWMHAATAATPVGANEGILVVLFLGGGNDGFNTVAPISGPQRGHYEQLRGGLAHQPGALRPLDDGWGLHPVMGHLHARYRRGQVAVVQGGGIPTPDLSHFTAMATTMRGGAGDGTGWLGRYLDGVSEADSGMRAMTIGAQVPLYLQGRQAKVTAIPRDGSMWGAERSGRGDDALMDAVEAFGAAPTGLGERADSVAQSTSRAVGTTAATVRKAFGQPIDAAGVAYDLVLAARLLNANLGTRVVGVMMGGFDTHITQSGVQQGLLNELDQSIEAFFATLDPAIRNRVTMLVQSEFGRRPEANASMGTDHGTASLQLVIGSGVRGGRHAAPPDFGRLDERGNVVPTVDFRSVYAQVIDRWLGGDSKQILGGSFGGLDLFKSTPRT